MAIKGHPLGGRCTDRSSGELSRHTTTCHYSHTGHTEPELRPESPDSQDRTPFLRTTDPSVPKAKSKYTAAHSALIHGYAKGRPCSPGRIWVKGQDSIPAFCTQMRGDPLIGF